MTHYMVSALECCRIAPKGSTATSSMLQVSWSKGGRDGALARVCAGGHDPLKCVVSGVDLVSGAEGGAIPPGFQTGDVMCFQPVCIIS